jgi:elongation factor P hydroxylase
MFPLPISTWIMAGLSVIALAGFGYGKYQHNKYVNFKTEVEAIAKIQEAHVESIQKQHALVTKGIANEYDAKIAALRNYYKSTSVWNSNSSQVSGLSTTPKSVDVITAYNVLAGSCSETTQQLVSLQEWINAQIGIK